MMEYKDRILPPSSTPPPSTLSVSDDGKFDKNNIFLYYENPSTKNRSCEKLIHGEIKISPEEWNNSCTFSNDDTSVSNCAPSESDYCTYGVYDNGDSNTNSSVLRTLTCPLNASIGDDNMSFNSINERISAVNDYINPTTNPPKLVTPTNSKPYTPQSFNNYNNWSRHYVCCPFEDPDVQSCAYSSKTGIGIDLYKSKGFQDGKGSVSGDKVWGINDWGCNADDTDCTSDYWETPGGQATGIRGIDLVKQAACSVPYDNKGKAIGGSPIFPNSLNTCEDWKKVPSNGENPQWTQNRQCWNIDNVANCNTQAKGKGGTELGSCPPATVLKPDITDTIKTYDSKIKGWQFNLYNTQCPNCDSEYCLCGCDDTTAPIILNRGKYLVPGQATSLGQKMKECN